VIESAELQSISMLKVLKAGRLQSFDGEY